MLTRLVEPTLEGQPQTRKRHLTGHLGIELQGVIAQEASQRQRDRRDLLSASSDIIGIQGDIQCRVFNPPLAGIDPGRQRHVGDTVLTDLQAPCGEVARQLRLVERARGIDLALELTRDIRHQGR